MAINRDNSVRIDFGDFVPDPANIIDAIYTACKTFTDKRKLLCLQPYSQTKYEVTMATFELATLIIEDGITVGDRHFPAYSANEKGVWLRIRVLPHEVPSTEVEEAIQKYGIPQSRVIRETWSFGKETICNGTRKVKIELNGPAPEEDKLCGYNIRLHYHGIERSCFACKKEGHLKGDCPDRKPKASDENVAKDTPPTTVAPPTVASPKPETPPTASLTKQPETETAPTEDSTGQPEEVINTPTKESIGQSVEEKKKAMLANIKSVKHTIKKTTKNGKTSFMIDPNDSTEEITDEEAAALLSKRTGRDASEYLAAISEDITSRPAKKKKKIKNW